MNTGEIVKQLAERLKISQKQARWLFKQQLEILKRQLAEGDAVVLRNFGSFSVKNRAPHRGFLPSEGRKVLIPAKKQVSFRPGKGLKESVADWRPSE